MDLAPLIAPMKLGQETFQALIVLVLPLCSFLILGFLRNRLGILAGYLATLVGLVGLGLSVNLFIAVWNYTTYHFRTTWFDISLGKLPLNFTVGVYLDNLTVLMLVMVSLIALLVIIFSLAYMKDDPQVAKYYAFLGLFQFSMMGIILVDNLLFIFIFWELVGLSSYLLIGFWYQKTSAALAAKKAFLFNKVGDLGFMIALMMLWSQFYTLDIDAIKFLWQQASLSDQFTLTVGGFSVWTDMSDTWMTWIGIALFCAAVGKSAQFPLQVWLPDAMAGPTPVSALIHAATMVAAGVYLLARVLPLFTVDVMLVLSIIGALTALMGAFAALAQSDIKKILAYSTISQLGMMVMGIGVYAVEAAVFHLFTHAVFKAGLFLAAGSVIHSLHQYEAASGQHLDAQDTDQMGGLRKFIPLTFLTFVLCGLGLIGFPGFSGFLSKEGIIEGAFAWANNADVFAAWLIPVMAILTSLLTAFYIIKLIIKVFFGKSPQWMMSHHPISERGWAIKFPLVVLGLLSFSIWYGHPFDGHQSWLGEGVSRAIFGNEFVPTIIEGKWSMVLALLALLAGGTMAIMKYGVDRSYFTETVHWLKSMSYHNFHLDAIYLIIFIRPSYYLASAITRFDQHVLDRSVNLLGISQVLFAHIIAWIDRAVVDGLVSLVAKFSQWFGVLFRWFVHSRVQSKILWAVLFVVLIILIWIR